jgi:hypothetical protein
MDLIDRILSSTLYRISCPSPDDLGEYHLQMLSNEETEAIRQHLATCPHCSREIAQLQSYLKDLAPDLEFAPQEDSIQERVKIWIAKLLPPPDPALRPAFGLRGEAESPLMFEAGSYQLTLEIQDDPAKPGFRTILGLVIGGADRLQQVELWQDGRSIQTTTLDELGNFVFAGVQPGHYDLILSQLAAEIHVEAFTV